MTKAEGAVQTGGQAEAAPLTGGAIGVAFACGLGNVFGLSTIIFYTFSIFLVPVTEALGWSRAELSFSLTIIAVIGLFAYPVGGVLMDRYSARPVILTGNLVFGLAVMALATIGPNRIYAYLIFALIGASAALQSTVLLTRVVSGWFERRRGLALSMASGLAFGVGGLLTPALAHVMIAAHGWRFAYCVLGALPIIISLPVMGFLLREHPRAVRVAGPIQDDDGSLSFRHAVRTRIFIFLILSAAIGAGAVNAVSSHLVLFLQDDGLGGGLAAAAVSALAAMASLWQVVLGRILDRTRSPRVAGLFLLAAACGAVLLFTARTTTSAILGSALMGVGSGTEFGLLPFCLSRYFGLGHYGLTYGVMFGAVSLVIGSSPFFVDLAYGYTASYAAAGYACAAALVLSAALLFSLPDYPENGCQFRTRRKSCGRNHS